jgi:hypothetical protein
MILLQWDFLAWDVAGRSPADLAGAGDHGRIESREAIEAPAMHRLPLICFLCLAEQAKQPINQSARRPVEVSYCSPLELD